MTYDFNNLRPYPPHYPAYPPYSDPASYMEHYFFDFFKKNLAEMSKCERQYIPVFWTTLYNDHAAINVQEYLDVLPREGKYYTIVQHDDGIRYTLPPDTIVFSASEHGSGQIIPVPLLTSPIPFENTEVTKDILCSFVGSNTHPIRRQLLDVFSHDKDFYFSDLNNWTPAISDDKLNEFIDITRRSKFALAPRGNIIQSFRIYEILQLGAVPIIVSDEFFYPFKDDVSWDHFSLSISPDKIFSIKDYIELVSDDDYRLMMRKGQETYAQFFTLEAMCHQIKKILLVNTQIAVNRHMKIIQIGANDGRDHVLEYVSNNNDKVSNLILIEANPACIPSLTETYKTYPFAEIHNFAVVSGNEGSVDLLIPATDDVSAHSSVSSDHMINHGHSNLQSVTVPAKNINKVLSEFSDGTVDRLYIDVEGFDIQLINEIDFSQFNIPYICFEFIHSDGPRSYGGPNLDACVSKLKALGYTLSSVEYNIIAQK